MQFVNPATGGYPLPTIGAFLQFLPRDFHGTPYRSTDATVFYVIEGHGTSQVGDTSIAWQPHDIFVVPSWNPVAHADGRRRGAVQFFRSAGSEGVGAVAGVESR